MSVFPGYILETIRELTLVQFAALKTIAETIRDERAKAMSL